MSLPLTFQFCSFNSTIAKVIDWGTQSDVGHVDLVWPSWKDQISFPSGSLLGAQHESGLGGKPSGVYPRGANYGRACGMENKKQITLLLEENCANYALDWAHAQIGAEYDIKALEGIALGKDWSSEGKFICSGFAAGILTQPALAFIGHELEKNWRIVNPGQLLLMLNTLAPVVVVGEV